MAATPLLIVQHADLITRFGDDTTVAQVLDDGTGNYNATLMDRAIEDASGDVAASCGNNFKLWLAAGSFPQWVKKLCAIRAMYYCWLYGSNGKAIPEKLRQAFEDTTADLEKIEQGRKSLGDDPDPPARRARAPIDNSDGGRRAVYSVWRRAGLLGGR